MDEAPHITIGDAVRYPWVARLECIVWMLLPVLPLGLGMLAFHALGLALQNDTAWGIVEILGIGGILDGILDSDFGVLLWILPALLYGLLVWVAYPTSFLYWKIASRLRDLRRTHEQEGAICFFVRLFLSPRPSGYPRIRGGYCDDVGLFSIQQSGISFVGGSININLPWHAIGWIGSRGCGIAEQWFYLGFCEPVSGRDGMWLLVHEGWTVFQLRRRIRGLQDILASYCRPKDPSGEMGDG